jgi:hypothetical protein
LHQLQNQCGFDALKFNKYGRDLDGEVSYRPFSRLSSQFFTAACQNLRPDVRGAGRQRMAGVVQPHSLRRSLHVRDCPASFCRCRERRRSTSLKCQAHLPAEALVASFRTAGSNGSQSFAAVVTLLSVFVLVASALRVGGISKLNVKRLNIVKGLPRYTAF